MVGQNRPNRNRFGRLDCYPPLVVRFEGFLGEGTGMVPGFWLNPNIKPHVSSRPLPCPVRLGHIIHCYHTLTTSDPWHQHYWNFTKHLGDHRTQALGVVEGLVDIQWYLSDIQNIPPTSLPDYLPESQVSHFFCGGGLKSPPRHSSGPAGPSGSMATCWAKETLQRSFVQGLDLESNGIRFGILMHIDINIVEPSFELYIFSTWYTCICWGHLNDDAMKVYNSPKALSRSCCTSCTLSKRSVQVSAARNWLQLLICNDF